MQRWFKDWQSRNDVEIKIDMQGLRKSGAMYKLRLSDYDYQAVQLETGHSTPNVLMEHYNEVMVSEKSRLAEKFENDFYAGIDYLTFAKYCYRILQNNSHAYFFTRFDKYPHHYDCLTQAGFTVKNCMVIEKAHVGGIGDLYGSYANNCEWIIFCHKGRRVFSKTELIKNTRLRDKVYAGEAYHDNNLVFCFEDGRSIEPKRCSKWFKSWQSKSDFGAEKIVFHQLRHSSTSFKLAISDGDIKAVQGDSGHTTLALVADVYGHALKSKKEMLANKFDSEFYGKTKPSEPSANDKLLSSVVLEQIQKDPTFLESILLALNASNTQVLPD